MRAQDPDWQITKNGDGDSWRINIEPGLAWKQPGAWGTPFTAFRFAVPELCNFEGRAVYLDADMLVRADVRELLEMPLTKGYRCISKTRTDVSVIDCSFFKDKPWWPKIADMKKTGWTTGPYCQILMRNDAIDHTLDLAWNACDPMTQCPDPGVDCMKLLHFTVVPTQPYKPYPSVTYFKHPWKTWVDEWNATLAEARAAAV